jgi:hypothetical protein
MHILSFLVVLGILAFALSVIGLLLFRNADKILVALAGPASTVNAPVQMWSDRTQNDRLYVTFRRNPRANVRREPLPLAA